MSEQCSKRQKHSLTDKISILIVMNNTKQLFWLRWRHCWNFPLISHQMPFCKQTVFNLNETSVLTVIEKVNIPGENRQFNALKLWDIVGHVVCGKHLSVLTYLRKQHHSSFSITLWGKTLLGFIMSFCGNAESFLWTTVNVTTDILII